MGARRGRRGADRPARRRGRHHVLRHRRRLQRRPERGRHRARPAASCSARARSTSSRRRCMARRCPARTARGLVAQARPRVDRRVARSARAGLRRPLPDPPLGSRDADRGDDGGAARRRAGGQGALHRREQHVRVAVREGAGVAERTAGRAFVSMQNHYNLVYREEEREMIPQCIDQGVGDPAVEPARARAARRQPHARGRAADGSRRDGLVRRLALHARGRLRRRRRGRGGGRPSAASRRRRSRSPGCCTSPA